MRICNVQEAMETVREQLGTAGDGWGRLNSPKAARLRELVMGRQLMAQGAQGQSAVLQTR
jgi:hypothetical protein